MQKLMKNSIKITDFAQIYACGDIKMGKIC
jgi:hypothetical protein